MLSAEKETMKNEISNLNLKLKNLEQQIYEVKATESSEKPNSQISLQVENSQKIQNFLNIEKISETEFNLEILDETISDVIFETASNPMEFNLSYKRNLSIVFSDPNTRQKSQQPIKELCFVQFSLDHKNMFKFDKLDERRIKKYSERLYHIKYIYSGSYISKKPYDKDKKPNLKKPEITTNENPKKNIEKCLSEIHESFISDDTTVNKEIQKKEPDTPKFIAKSLSSGSDKKIEESANIHKESINSNELSQITEDFASGLKETIKKKKNKKEKTETLNEYEKAKNETCENGSMMMSKISDFSLSDNGSSFIRKSSENNKMIQVEKPNKKASKLKQSEFITPQGPSESHKGGLSLSNASLEISDIFVESAIIPLKSFKIQSKKIKESESESESD